MEKTDHPDESFRRDEDADRRTRSVLNYIISFFSMACEPFLRLSNIFEYTCCLLGPSVSTCVWSLHSSCSTRNARREWDTWLHFRTQPPNNGAHQGILFVFLFLLRNQKRKNLLFNAAHKKCIQDIF